MLKKLNVTIENEITN